MKSARLRSARPTLRRCRPWPGPGVGIDRVEHRPAAAVPDPDQGADTGGVGPHLVAVVAAPKGKEREVVAPWTRRPERDTVRARDDQDGSGGGCHIDGTDARQVVCVALDKRGARTRIDDRNAVAEPSHQFEVAVAVEVRDVEHGRPATAGRLREGLRDGPGGTVETPPQQFAVRRDGVDLALAVGVRVGRCHGGEGASAQVFESWKRLVLPSAVVLPKIVRWCSVQNDEVEIAVVVEIRDEYLPAVAAADAKLRGKCGERAIPVIVV